MKEIVVKMVISYDGSHFYGWQRQNHHETVQGEIEKHLSRLYKTKIEIHGAGRTDRGVHSYGQVAHFKAPDIIPIIKLQWILNNQLPKTICIKSAEEVSKEFHSRYCAKGKKYIYKMNLEKEKDPFKASYYYQVKDDIDIERMKEGARGFIGTHDFSGFMASGSAVQDTVRTIHEISFKKDENILEIEFYGNGFLYNMVRIIVGTLLDVGKGKIKPSEVKDIVASKDRNRAKITAPAEGLYLKEVCY